MEKWQKFQSQILEQLDIQNEYVALGVQFVPGAQPSAFGWLPCHAMGRDDEHASAAVNIGMGPSRGRYKDFGGDQVSLGLFDFAAKYGPCSSWKDAREFYSLKAGVAKPRCEEVSHRDVFGPQSVPGMAACHLYAQSKPGVLADVIPMTGGQEAVYSFRYPIQLRQSVLVWRFWGASGVDGEPIGYHASRYDGEKIAIHQKNKNEPDRVKTVSKGTVGLLNDWCLRHYSGAEVIWLVEGLSDMLVMQSILGLQNTSHLVTTMGGASARINSQLINVFAGKQVYICYDRDGAGEKGAFENAARLSAVAEVRIVSLPEQGQDLRDWVQLGHDYHHLFDLATQSQAVVPGSPEVEESVALQSQGLLHELGGRIIARSSVTNKIAIWSYGLRRVTWIDGLQWLGYYDLCACFDSAQFLHLVDREDYQYTLGQLKRDIALAADQCPQVDESLSWKVGCWLHEGQILLVNGETADSLGSTGLAPVAEPVWGGQLIEYPVDRQSWYDREMLGACLATAHDQQWRQQVMQEFEGWFQQFSNWERASSPSLLAACLAASMLETVWTLRPHIAITGQTNVGKSTLVESFIRPLLGSLCTAMLAPTEAAVRQTANNGANVVLVDEFDTAPDQEALLEMARAATRKQSISRGTRSGKAMRFSVHHSFFFTGVDIERYLTKLVDRNRFLVLGLTPYEQGVSQAPIPPTVAQAIQMRHRILAVVLAGHEQIKATAAAIERLEWIEGRLPQVYALPVSVLAWCYGWTVDQSREHLASLLAELEGEVTQVIHESRKDSTILAKILTQQVRLPKGAVATVHELVANGFVTDSDNTPYGQEIVAHLGVCRHLHPDGGEMLFVSPVIASQTLRGERTPLHPSEIRKSLQSVAGAVSSIQQVCGSRKRGVSIPVAAAMLAIEGLVDEELADSTSSSDFQDFGIDKDDDF
jgi:hypothetical protein